MIRVAIVGGSGYGAIELIRLLNKHPYVQLKSVVSHSQSGTEMNEVYPHLTEVVDMTMDKWDVESLANEVDLVFFATPAGVSQRLIPQCTEKGLKCIDLSGDFRLQSPQEYREWYGMDAAPEELLQETIYGLSEWYGDDIQNAAVIANPGCYPTASLLALLPAIKAGIVEENSIIIDGKSGVSGAGRSVSLNTHFSELNENMKAYKIGNHQHIPEMEQFLSLEAKKEIKVSFTPHLVPMTRGIMCTIYFQLKGDQSTEQLLQLYKHAYEEKTFVRIRKEGVFPTTKEVLGSNYCDMGMTLDRRTNRVTIVSVIDNLVKGAAGQAIQNLNIMYSWDETSGIDNLPIYP